MELPALRGFIPVLLSSIAFHRLHLVTKLSTTTKFDIGHAENMKFLLTMSIYVSCCYITSFRRANRALLADLTDFDQAIVAGKKGKIYNQKNDNAKKPTRKYDRSEPKKAV